MSSTRTFFVIFTICACGILSCFGASSSSSSLSIGNGYEVTKGRTVDDNYCKLLIYVDGNGLRKILDSDCSFTPSAINMNKTLLVYNLPSSAYYSEEPGVLIHVSGDNCVKEVFSDKDGKPTSQEEKKMSKEDCKTVKSKIFWLEHVREDWEILMAEKGTIVRQQLETIKKSIQEIELQLFSEFPFGKK